MRDGRVDLASVLRDLRSAHVRLREVLGPLARTLGRDLVDAAAQIHRRVPPEAWTNIRQFVDERDDALARRVRWVTQLHELTTRLVSGEIPTWESLAMFWVRLYGLHDLREQIDADASTDAERALLQLIDVSTSKLTSVEWEAVRFIRNNEAHPWAERQAIHWRNDGPRFEIRSFGGEVLHVRELAERRTLLYDEHGGEVGYARVIAERVGSDLPALVDALRGQRNGER